MTRTQDERPRTQTENPKSDEVVGIILAAGQSRRMGAFKPLLPFGDKTVIDSCIQNLRDGGVADILVVIGGDARAEELRNRLQQSNVHFVVNPDTNSEMSASIACAIRIIPESRKAILINPVDHAAVPPAIIKLLINEWMSGKLLVKPTWKGQGGHPVLIDLSFREPLLHLDPDGGLKSFLNEHQTEVTRIAVHSNLIARDMDTWDDYRSLHQEVFGVLPAKQPIDEHPVTKARNSEESN
jgi:molybdenum cofactor cytidylyltransferase